MQVSKLTVNGIEKLIGSLSGIVVQVISVQQKLQNNQCYYSCQISDGFCKIKGCIIESLQNFQKNRLRDFTIIKINQFDIQKSKKHKTIGIVESYQIINDRVTKMIGLPIIYEEYVKNGKNNANGDNVIPVEKKQNIVKKESVSVDMNEARKQNSNTNRSNITAKSMPKNAVQANQNPQNTKIPAKNNGQDSKNISRDNKPKGGPIQKIEYKDNHRKSEQLTRGRQNKPNSSYTDIKSLYLGMENWSILGRIISMNPLKNFINKKGVQSSVLGFQIGDKSGMIQCNVFGENASRLGNTIKQDQIYQISNAMVNQNSYLGVHKLKLTLGELAKVNLKEDDPGVPYMQDFCVSVKRLLQMNIGEQARVICLVKDDSQIETITTKDGKTMRKKKLLLCDPIDKVQAQITMWNDSCDYRFEKYPYMLKGVLVKQYQGNRQYTLKSNFVATLLKQHSLRKYIKELENISFSNPDSNNKPRKTKINCLKDLNSAMDEGNNNGTWSQVICFVSNFRLSGKNYYISCPKCKKKVIETENVECISCNTFYQQAKYRYILNLGISDFTDSIWITAYDETAQSLVGFPAQQFAGMGENQLNEHFRMIKYKFRKLRMVTKNEEFNGVSRKKTSIIKILELNFGQETKLLLQKVKHLLPN